MRITYRKTWIILLLCAFVPAVCRAPEAAATESRPAQRKVTTPAAKNSRVEASRIRSSRATPPRRGAKQSRRSARQSLSRMQRLSRPAWQARVLDPLRIQTIDGESFQYGKERFRVRGIDATQMADAWGARQRLDELLHQGAVTVVPTETDLHGRIVAEVLVNNHNVLDLLNNP